MAYRLTEDLETGNMVIDKEHREMFEAINHLLDACGNGGGGAELASSLHFLTSYTSKHFVDEELLQLKSGYPDYANHHRFHEDYKKVMSDLSEQLNKNGPTEALVGEVSTSVADWLVDHIRCEDKKLAEYLHKTP